MNNVAELAVWLSRAPAGAKVYLRCGDVVLGELQTALLSDLSVTLVADDCDVSDPETGVTTRIRGKEEACSPSEPTLDDRVAQFLRANPCWWETPRIASGIGVSHRQAVESLFRLRSVGRVKMSIIGTWALVNDGCAGHGEPGNASTAMQQSVEQRIQQFDAEAPFSFFGVPEDHPRHGWVEIDWLRWLATGSEPTEGAANGNEST